MLIDVQRDGLDPVVTLTPDKVRRQLFDPLTARFQFEHRPGTGDLWQAWFIPEEPPLDELEEDILAAIKKEPGINTRGLRKQLKARPASVTQAIGTLKKGGLIRVCDGPRNSKNLYPRDVSE